MPQRSTQLIVLEGGTGVKPAESPSALTQTRDVRVTEVDAPASVVQVRTGEESSIIVSYDSRAEDYRSAASYVAEYEAEAQKSRMLMLSRLTSRGNGFL